LDVFDLRQRSALQTIVVWPCSSSAWEASDVVEKRCAWAEGALRRATARDVRRIFGKIDDETVAEILRTGSTLEDLREVCSWLVRQGDVMAWQGQTKTCGTAAILEFVTTGADLSAEKLVLSRGGKGSLKQAFRPT
jgi:hypothetical protein